MDDTFLLDLMDEPRENLNTKDKEVKRHMFSLSNPSSRDKQVGSDTIYKDVICDSRNTLHNGVNQLVRKSDS